MSGPEERDAEAASDVRIGTLISERYRINEILGEGGMGKVYAAEHVLMRKKLAIKILHRELTTVPEVVQRFEREAMAAANIEHANVAAATDFGKLADGSVFLVLEFVSGRNLRDEIAQGPLSVDRALHITRQIASALASAHDLDIVHRDLKPENVMLVEKAGDRDFVKVLDFGIAKVPIGEGAGEGRAITKVGMVFGTPEYMAPEQALGQTVDGRADLYALGVIAYEMISGVRPFSSKSPVGILGQQLSRSPPAFAERSPGLFVPPAVEHFVHRLLAKEASDRFPTARDVTETLATLLQAPTRGQLFTMAAGSPAAVPPLSAPPVSIPDLEAPSVSEPFPVPVAAEAPTEQPVGWEVPDEELLGAPAAVPPVRPPVSGPGHTLVGLADPGGIVSPSARLSGPGPRSLLESSPKSPLAAHWDRVLDAVDDLREKLPPGIRRPLRDVPSPAFVAAAALLLGGALLFLVVIIGALLRGATSPSSPSATLPVSAAPPMTAGPVTEDSNQAPEAEFAAAQAGGVEAMTALTRKYPKDSKALIWLSAAELADKKYTAALATIERALVLDPSANTDPKLASVLWALAQRKESQEETFRLLQGPMGARGADIVYDLSVKGNAMAKTRANKWLNTPDFQRVSSPALNVLVALAGSRTCKQSHALLLRARNVGDHRVLTLLQQWKGMKKGCGRATVDCACLTEDDRIDQAIAEIQKRVSQ